MYDEDYDDDDEEDMYVEDESQQHPPIHAVTAWGSDSPMNSMVCGTSSLRGGVGVGSRCAGACLHSS